jgi:hypothetical protein
MSEGRPFEWPKLHIAEKSRSTWNDHTELSIRSTWLAFRRRSPQVFHVEQPYRVESIRFTWNRHFAEMSPRPFHVEQLFLKLENRFT